MPHLDLVDVGEAFEAGIGVLVNLLHLRVLSLVGLLSLLLLSPPVARVLLSSPGGATLEQTLLATPPGSCYTAEIQQIRE